MLKVLLSTFVIIVAGMITVALDAAIGASGSASAVEQITNHSPTMNVTNNLLVRLEMGLSLVVWVLAVWVLWIIWRSSICAAIKKTKDYLNAR